MNNKDRDNLISRLISNKNKKERIFSRSNSENDLDEGRKDRRALKKAVKTAKNNWMRNEIIKLQNLNIDPYTA